MKRILVVEDEPSIADFVKRGLTLNGFEAQVAHSGAAGLELTRATQPDLIVLDLLLPDIDGIELCRVLKNETDAGIIMLTARNLVGDRVRGLEAGADDYLPKPFAFEELLARIRSVIRRTSDHQPVVRVGDLEIDFEQREVRRGGRQIDLTNREYELLRLLAENAGKPLSRDFIVGRLWGYESEGLSDPAKVYISYLRRKLNCEGEPDLIHTLRGFGYVLREAR